MWRQEELQTRRSGLEGRHCPPELATGIMRALLQEPEDKLQGAEQPENMRKNEHSCSFKEHSCAGAETWQRKGESVLTALGASKSCSCGSYHGSTLYMV